MPATILPICLKDDAFYIRADFHANRYIIMGPRDAIGRLREMLILTKIWHSAGDGEIEIDPIVAEWLIYWHSQHQCRTRH